ncbi:tyrosine-type recombinase/integrase [Intestinibacter sp.]
MQLNELLEEFVFDLQVRNISKRTIKTYRNNINQTFTYLQNEYDIHTIEEIEPRHIKGYAKFMKDKGNKISYINSIYKSLRAFFKYCFSEEYIKINPMKRVGWQKDGKRVIETFTDQEVVEMLAFYKGRDFMSIRNKTIIYCLVDLGIRANELCEMDSLNIFETNLKIIGKGNKERYLPISPVLKKQMMKYERARAIYYQNNPMKYTNYFLSYRGNPLTVEAIERVVKLCGKECNIRENIRCSPHTFRHYYAQKHLRNGLDIYTLSRLLGHETVGITKTYLQSLQDSEVIEMGIITSPLMNLK